MNALVTPSPEAVREELARILASAPFATAARARRFLTYVVEQTLAAQTDGIKELVLATEVFDRPASFDPRLDTIVRVEAGKVRKRLDEYYASAGSQSAIRIEIPRGSYVPRIHLRDDPSSSGTKDGGLVHRGSRRRFLPGAVIVAVIGIAFVIWGPLWDNRAPTATSPAPLAIAVLPFDNFSPDPANEYLADGFAEDLTDALTRIGGIRVASRTSAFTFKGRHADVREIGAKLNVGYVIEGSVRRDGERLKVSAQLVRTDDGYHVWSRAFERDVRDILAVQDEVARAVVSGVQLKLSSGQGAKPHTPTFEAFDLYLRGVHAMQSNLDQAEMLLQRSIKADPAYARPYVALAR